jgi:hypothetical protein
MFTVLWINLKRKGLLMNNNMQNIGMRDTAMMSLERPRDYRQALKKYAFERSKRRASMKRNRPLYFKA